MRKTLTLLGGLALVGGAWAAEAAEPFGDATPLPAIELAEAAGMFALAAAAADAINVAAINQNNVGAVAAGLLQINAAELSQNAHAQADAAAIQQQVAVGNVFVGALVQD